MRRRGCHCPPTSAVGVLLKDEHYYLTFWWEVRGSDRGTSVVFRVGLSTGYRGNPRVSTARATAFHCTWRFHDECHGCGHGTCRGSVRGNLRHTNHGNPRKYRGHCPGPPPKSQIMCIRTTAVCAMATTGALAVEAPCTMESRGPCRGNSRISTVARGKTRGRPRKCRGHCRGHCRGPCLLYTSDAADE